VASDADHPDRLALDNQRPAHRGSGRLPPRSHDDAGVESRVLRQVAVDEYGFAVGRHPSENAAAHGHVCPRGVVGSGNDGQRGAILAGLPQAAARSAEQTDDVIEQSIAGLAGIDTERRLLAEQVEIVDRR